MGHLIHLIEICTGITSNQQHTEQIVDITDVIHIQRIDDLHTIHHHVVGIELRLQGLRSKTPHAFIVLHEIYHTRSIKLSIAFHLDLLRWQEVASDLHLLCLWGNEVESYWVVSVYIGRSHLRALSPAQVLLSLRCCAHQAKSSHYQESCCFHFLYSLIGWCKDTKIFWTFAPFPILLNLFTF